MKKLLLFVCMGWTMLYAQNLVPNPGFESNTGCPSGRAQWYFANDWTNGTARVNNGRGNLNGTPDYFSTCGVGDFQPPTTYYGIMSPRSGNAMMGIATYRSYSPNFREYLGVQLDSVLQPGTPYQVEFYYANGVNSTPSIFNFGGQGTVLGVYFSNALLTQFNSNTPIVLTPDFETPNPIYSAGWQRLSFTFTPTTPVRYMFIGNFRNDANTAVTLFATPGILRKAYYFFDDVSVTRSRPLNAGNPVSETVTNEPVETQIYVAGGKLYLDPDPSELQVFHIEVVDMNGRVLWGKSDRTDQSTVYKLPDFLPGVYIASLQTANGIKTCRFLVQ